MPKKRPSSPAASLDVIHSLGNPEAEKVECCGLSLPPLRLMFLGGWVSLMCLATYGIQDVALNIPSSFLPNVTEEQFYKHYHSHVQKQAVSFLWGVIVASLAMGAVIGAACAIPLANRFGRKAVLLFWTNAIVVIGSAMMHFAKVGEVFELLILGRLILGIAVGLSTTVLPMYLMELSATSSRGFLGSMQGLSNQLCMSLTTVLALKEILGNDEGWGWLLSLQAFFSVAMLLTSPLCPESPQYLYIQRNDEKAAFEVASKYCSDGFKILKARWECERKIGFTLKANKDGSIPGPLKEAITLSILIGATRSFSGVTVWNTYSTLLLTKQNITNVTWSSYATLVSQMIAIFTSFGNAIIIDKMGRRLCFLGGLLLINLVWLMVFSFWLLEPVIGKDSVWTEWVCLIALEFSFSVISPLATSNVTWFLASELVPESIRAMIQGISMVALWTTYLFTALLYPIMLEHLVGWSIPILFILPSAMIWSYLYIYLPETSKKSFVDVYAEISRTTWHDHGELPPHDPELEYALRNRLGGSPEGMKKY